jgi:transketolase
VVSLASFELFFERPQAERDTVLPPGMPRVAVEAASPFGWCVLADAMVGMHSFGASGKAEELYPHFGITPETVAAEASRVLADRGQSPDGGPAEGGER